MPTVEMNVLVPAIAALGGALVGSVAPIIVGVVQSRAETRRERMRLATQLAIEEHNYNVEMGREQAARGVRGVSFAPLSTYVAYHAEILELLSHKAVTPEQFVELRRKAGKVFDALKEHQRSPDNKS